MSTPDATGLVCPPVAIPQQATPNSATRSSPVRPRDHNGRFISARHRSVVYAVGQRWDRDINPAGYDTAIALNTDCGDRA